MISKIRKLQVTKYVITLFFSALLIIMKAHAQDSSSPRFTERFLFEDIGVSVLEENVEMKFDKDLNVEKTIEYLIKNISEQDEIIVYFATENKPEDVQLTLNDAEISFEKKIDNTKNKEITGIEHQNMVDISVPISNAGLQTHTDSVIISTYPQVYSYRLPLKKGEFGKIRLNYHSKNVIIRSEELIHPVHTQVHQILPAGHFVSGAVVNLKLEIPKSVSIRSNHALQKVSEKTYNTVLQKTIYSNWVVNLISTDGLWFMSNFRKENNDNLLKTLAAVFLFSFVLFLVRRRELTKNKRSEFAQLKANIFGSFSFLLYLTGIGILYFYKLPSAYEKYWNIVYALIIIFFVCLSYLAYKYRHKFNISFSE